MKLHHAIAVAGSLFVAIFTACLHVHLAEAPADPLTSRFKVGDVVQSISSPETFHIIDTRKDASFISTALKGQPAYKVRRPAGDALWMAESELKLSGTGEIRLSKN